MISTEHRHMSCQLNMQSVVQGWSTCSNKYVWTCDVGDQFAVETEGGNECESYPMPIKTGGDTLAHITGELPYLCL